MMFIVYEKSGIFFFFQAVDGIRDLVRSRGLGDVYKRQLLEGPQCGPFFFESFDVIILINQVYVSAGGKTCI